MRKVSLLLLFGTGWLGLMDAQAQLISPGKLSSFHSDLEGLSNCTQCHALGERSSSNNLCLDCHEPIQVRIDAGTGYHANEEVVSQNCASCHKEHFGVEFIPVRFDIETFDHDEAGYPLLGAHEEIECRTCHEPSRIADQAVVEFMRNARELERTFLGLPTTCRQCHVEDSPHEGQFEETTCNTCHTEELWEEAPLFDHDDAQFVLTGAHLDVDCASCHVPEPAPEGVIPFVPYRNLEFAQCSACHADPHEGSLGPDCASCHSASDWGQLSDLAESSFDHATTNFNLVGAHAEATCQSCHGKPARRDDDYLITFTATTRQNSYPSPAFDTCMSCHTDYHEGVFEDASGGAVCDNCHGEEAWTPVSFGLFRHNRESTFELTGAHIATPCSGCHLSDESPHPFFEIADQTCQGCHVPDNPHGDQFADLAGATTCETCHETDAWQPAFAFNHDETDFPLTGAHTEATCLSCHPADPDPSGIIIQQFVDTPLACASCHEEDDPHKGQFPETTCDTCHDTAAFTIADFDHERTEFPLTGAHVSVSCESCHQEEHSPLQEPFIRYKPLSTQCVDCHGDL